MKKLVPKDTFETFSQYNDPFLYSRSVIVSGQGKAIVCNAGNDTYVARYYKESGIILGAEDPILEENKTKTISFKVIKDKFKKFSKKALKILKSLTQ